MRNHITAILLLFFVSASALAQDYDIVILNGRVMDPETEFDAVRNVGIKDGYIRIITEEAIEGADTLDATGLVVAPGFIDTHIHSASDPLFTKAAMMDGVTSGMDLECGGMNIADWYASQKGKRVINYGQSVCQEMARHIVHDGIEYNEGVDLTVFYKNRALSGEDGHRGWELDVSTLEQMNRINEILDENLRQGAIGVGTAPGYAPGGISTYELFEAQRTASRYGRVTGVHSRFHTSKKPPTEATLGFDEVLANAMALQAPLLYSHDNDYGWWEIEEKMELVREQGYNVWADYYPYAGTGPDIGAAGLRPEILEGALGLKYEEVMFDPTQSKFLTKEEYLKIAEEDPARLVVVYVVERREWRKHWVQTPHMTVGSDGMFQNERTLGWDDDEADAKGHPRAAGAHARVLRIGREEGVPLIFTLKQLSYWAAKHLGDTRLEFMQERGRMQEGMAADITIIDPETVTDTADYEPGKNLSFSVGLPHVIVNGQFVKRDNKAIKVFAGKPIRFPVEAKGRFVPVSKEYWDRTGLD